MSASPRESSPVDRRTAWKIVVSVLVCVGAVGGLFYASMAQDMQIYKMVDEVMVDPSAFKGKRLQVHGHVVEKSILNKQGTLEYRFKLESRAPRAPHVIEVRYKGIVPDTFKSGAEVVATGMLNADNSLGANHISAKCPSKYEAKEPSFGGYGAGGAGMGTTAPAAGPAAQGTGY